MKVYKFDKHGQLTNTFNSIIECSRSLEINRSYVYKAIDLCLQLKCGGTLSYYIKDRLATKSKIKCSPDVSDYVLMQNYYKNLIATLGEKIKDNNTSVIERDRIIREVVELNRFLTK